MRETMLSLSGLINRIRKSKEASNASWLIAGKVFQMILSFLISIFTARYLGPSNYGIINYATAYVAFFTSLCTLGINSVIVKDFVNNPEDQGQTIGTTVVLRAISSILSSLMIVLIVSIIDKGEPTTILVSFMCSLSLLFQVFDTINYWFQSRYESKVTAIATLIAYIVTSVYKIVLLIFGMNVVWFALATSIDYVCIAVFLLLAYKKHNGPKFKFSWCKGKELLLQSYHYILSGMMVAIYGQTDKLMIKQMMDSTSVGYYSLASSVNGMWVFVLAAVIDSMVPTIMKYHKEGNIEQFERKNRQLYAIVIYVSVFVAICMIIFGKWAIVLLYGEAYAPAANTLKIVAWYTIFSYLGVARNSWIVCENKQKYLKYMYLSAAIINVVLNYFLIPIWGPSGAAMASLITQICTSMVLPALVREMRPNTKLMIDAFRLKGIK